MFWGVMICYITSLVLSGKHNPHPVFTLLPFEQLLAFDWAFQGFSPSLVLNKLCRRRTGFIAFLTFIVNCYRRNKIPLCLSNRKVRFPFPWRRIPSYHRLWMSVLSLPDFESPQRLFCPSSKFICRKSLTLMVLRQFERPRSSCQYTVTHITGLRIFSVPLVAKTYV